MVTHKIDLDFTRPDRKHTVVLKQGSIRSVILQLVLHAEGARMDMTGVMMATMRGVTQAGTVIYDDIDITEDIVHDEDGNLTNEILYTLPETATSATGLTVWELELRGSLGEVLTSYNFYTQVENLIYDENDYLHDDDLIGWHDYYIRAMTAADNAEDQASAAATSADEAAASAVESAASADEAAASAEEAATSAEAAAASAEAAEAASRNPQHTHVQDDLDGAEAWYGVCSSAADQTNKIVLCPNYTAKRGAHITVTFPYGNTAAGMIWLNVNSIGNRGIYFNGDPVGARNPLLISEMETVEFVCVGSEYYVVSKGKASTSVWGMTKLSSSVSSTAEDVAATPAAVKRAYDLALEASSGTTDYEDLENKPSINSVTLIGNKTSGDLALQDAMEYLSNLDLQNILV